MTDSNPPNPISSQEPVPSTSGTSSSSIHKDKRTMDQPSGSSSTEPTSSPPPTPSQLDPAYKGYTGSMSEYCSELDNWLQRAHLQRECAVSAYYTALSLMFPNRSAASNGPFFPGPNGQAGGVGGAQGMGLDNNNVGAFMNMNFARPNQIIRRFLIRGVRTNNNVIAIDFNIAPIWKRILAECIDFTLLLIVKLFVTVTIIDSFELIDLDHIDLDAIQETSALLDVAMSLTWELLILELTHRIVVTFFEAWCLSKGGATPGKNVMNLRVLHCEQVIQIAPDQPVIDNNNRLINGGPGARVLVSPGSFLSFPRAFLRSAIKNFSLAFFFPFAFVFFHLEHTRTIYDLAAKSIVVEIRQ